MDFYPDDCEEFSVRPMLTTTCCALKSSDDAPVCFPCLPRCTKPNYCCEKPKQKAPPRTPAYCDLREHGGRASRSPRERSPRQRAYRDHEPCCSPPRPQRCESYCHPPCKPVKTKYVIPCYRYEDGRITNQPTLLMRRACEVAVGARPRRKPFVESCFVSDPEHHEHRFISEDDRGNCCYHFEKKKHCTEVLPFANKHRPRHLYGPCHSSPECQFYGQYVSAIPMSLQYGNYF